MKLNELRDAAHANSIAKGFHDKPQSVGDSVALMHSELSELLEDARAGYAPHECWYEDENGVRTDRPGSIIFATRAVGAGMRAHKPSGIPSEVADLIIRALDFCGKHGIDIEKAVTEKMAFNSTRPRMHGNKAF